MGWRLRARNRPATSRCARLIPRAAAVLHGARGGDDRRERLALRLLAQLGDLVEARAPPTHALEALDEQRLNERGAQRVDVLRAVEAAQAQGRTIKEAMLDHGLSEQTFYKWKRTYGSMDMSEVKRLRELEKENARLRKLVVELTLDKDILKEALEGKY